ncbi:hypothetical protein [Streptomyces sp. NBC_01601]|uniref:hypothetical protein n=1 Tax=Streptomyces sp. NBC_01601 TaxID=2975892 RepID=UPI002E2B94B0|nr:hypothetical protein [Streptomyces sp. NBC_01601]
MTKHNADPHVTFFGVQQGINHYVVRNGTVSTSSAWGTYEGVTAYLRYCAQLPDTPKCCPHQQFWWELRDVHTGNLIHTPPTGTASAQSHQSATTTAPDDWTCACAMRNEGGSDSCRGCHLTRSGQGEPMPPCTCGCDPTPGHYGDFDTESSASRQHFIDTGRFLRHGEILDAV